MVQVRVICPNCKTVHAVDERAFGRRARCKNCGFRFVLTRSSEAGSVLRPDAKPTNGGKTSESESSPSQRTVQAAVGSGFSQDGFLLLRCSQCQVRLKIAPQQAGRRIDCPKCKTRLIVPSVSRVGQADLPSRGDARDADSSTGETASEQVAEDRVAEVWNVCDVILDLYEVKQFNEQTGDDFAEGGSAE